MPKLDIRPREVRDPAGVDGVAVRHVAPCFAAGRGGRQARRWYARRTALPLKARCRARRSSGRCRAR
jgi:hypothetical protein